MAERRGEMRGEARISELLAGLPDPSFRERLRGELLAAATPIERIDAERIGVIADSHCRADDAADLPASVLDAFADVDLILHCGDLSTLAVLDRLESVAPVRGVRSQIDPDEDGDRLLSGPRVIEAGGVRIGMAAHIGDDIDPGLASLFGEPVQVALCGTTHEARIQQADLVLVVNPGSPTLPATGVPTVAILELRSGRVDATIIELEDS